MHYLEKDILEAARTIRSFLHDLTPPKCAKNLDGQLVEFLARAKTGAPVSAAIIDLLSERDETRNWMQSFLAMGNPPPVARGFQHLPGDAKRILGTKFECPDGDYIWYRPFVGVPVPQCPTHKRVLLQIP